MILRHIHSLITPSPDNSMYSYIVYVQLFWPRYVYTWFENGRLMSRAIPPAFLYVA
jgi:hypothetical protein